jgi:hypothetical protein
VIRILALALALAALASGCAADATYMEAPGQDDAWLREAAADAWMAAGVQAPTDYTLLFLDPETLADACGVDAAKLTQGSQLGGCTPTEDVILVNADNTPEQQLTNVIHELGHLLRGGDTRHLDCGDAADHGTEFGGDVMCLSGSGPGGMPTARDATFVSR